MEAWKSSSFEWNKSLLTRPSPPPDTAAAIFVKSTDEYTLGIIGPWKTIEQMNDKFGANNWRALPRFAVEQKNGYRVIDNGKSADHNNVVSYEERIHTSCIEQSIAIAAEIARQCALHNSSPEQVRGSRDRKRAYRQISCCEAHARWQIICVWHPQHKAWQFAELKGLAFGLAIAVLHFNRVPAHLTAMSRRWLGIPALNYFDDFRIAGVRQHSASCWRTFVKGLELVGWLFDPEKDERMAPEGPFLGYMEDVSQASNGVFGLAPKPDFEASVEHMLIHSLHTGVMMSGEAIHLANTWIGRVGRGQTFAFTEFIKAGGGPITDLLRRNLQFHLALLRLRLYRKADLRPGQRPRVTIYSDASCEPRP
jgi:hypothetical protein